MGTTFSKAVLTKGLREVLYPVNATLPRAILVRSDRPVLEISSGVASNPNVGLSRD